MSKSSITRLWVAGLIVLVAGLLVSGVSLGLMLADGGTWVPAASGTGSDFVPAMDGYFWTTVGFLIVGGTIALVGSIVQLAAWIAALVNSYQLADKAWFIALLAGGLLGLAFGLIGFAAMLAYLVAGPDGMPAGHQAIRPVAPVPPVRPVSPMPVVPSMPPTPPTPPVPESVTPQPTEYAHSH